MPSVTHVPLTGACTCLLSPQCRLSAPGAGTEHLTWIPLSFSTAVPSEALPGSCLGTSSVSQICPGTASLCVSKAQICWCYPYDIRWPLISYLGKPLSVTGQAAVIRPLTTEQEGV